MSVQSGVSGHAERARRNDQARWIPPGGLVNVRGFDIAGGMVYVGNSLSCSPGGGWNTGTAAPCLIDPSLEVASGAASPGTDMGYWPSYSGISPEHRLAYLTWLSTGKRDTSFPVGFAFLYFYGLERRLLADDPSPQEEDMLIAEVERLRALYAGNGSFRNYSRGLLDIVHLRRLSADSSGLNAWKPDLSVAGREFPLPLKIKLALHAATGTPLDFEHAFAGMLAMPPYQGGIRSTIAMTRSRPEYMELVRRRFARRFPQGFKLRDRKDSALILGYRPASQHLEINVRVEGSDRLPDPATLTWTKMAELCTKAAEDLVPHANVIGKDRGRATSLAAALALPADISDLGAAAAFREWLCTLDVPIAEVPLALLGRWCFGEGKEASGLRQAKDMSAMLGRMGFGLEPDPSYGGDRPGATVALFRASDAGNLVVPPSTAFHHAALVSAVLAPAGAGPEGARVVSGLASRLGLGPYETVRLAARGRVMQGRPLSASKLKSVAGRLSPEERCAVGGLAVSVAAACGEVSQQTIAALERLHDAFGVERRTLYAALHRGAAAVAACPTEPVVVEPSAAAGGRFRIPPPPLPVAGSGLHIDMAKVDAILRQTREVADVLAPIYEEDEKVPVVPPGSEPVGTRFAGLGAEHARLLEELSIRPSWTRAEFESKARAFGLMPDGAIETINEWSYDALGDELVEDGDPLSINVALLAGAQGEAA